MILYWVNVLYTWGKAGVPFTPLSDVVGPSCALSGPVCATSFLLALYFWLLCRIMLSTPIYLRFWAGWRLHLVWGSLVALTWTGWVWRRPPTVGAVRWSCVSAPWTPGCTSVRPAKKWWKSYSWRIRTSWISADATLLRGGWLSF